MAKDKKGSKAVAAAPAPAVSTVKSGRVTKPIESAKAVAKDAAKKGAKELEKVSKKAKKEPSPEPSDEEDDTSESSASSDDDSGEDSDMGDSGSDSDSSSGSDSEDEVPKKAEVPKVNGSAKPAVNGNKDDDSDSSSGSDSDDDEAPKVNGKTHVVPKDDDDSSSSSGSSDSDSDEEEDAKAGAKEIKQVEGEADDDDSSSASSSDDESDKEIIPKVEEAVKKRKAEESLDPTPKKTKTVNVDGEMKTAASNLFIGNLSWNIDEEWLTREFEEFGEITGVRVITDRDSGRSKGYGYVDFVETDSAIQALETKNGSMLDGRNIRIDFSVPRQQKSNNDYSTPQQRSSDRAQRYGDVPKEPSTTLFVGNIAFGAGEDEVSELFQEYGTINAVRLPTDKDTGEMKGFGYVEFSSLDESQAAFEALQGASVAGRPIRLDFASSRNNDSPRGGSWSRGGGRGGFSDRGGRGGGRGGFGDRGRGGFGDRGGRGRGAPRGRGNTTNRGGFGDFSGKKMTF